MEALFVDKNGQRRKHRVGWNLGMETKEREERKHGFIQKDR
ncbi:unnamed protein product [Linum tenue]|uniref:Uncharacterized protein n=1 Tax=Linum tenue TaxID=586396 RepID=A0AAV0I0N0_9ROSI|nr:unnamed protein product [Linum tenue]